MTPENFCYWLQGWIELQNPEYISDVQLLEIKNHLSLVFDKQTPYLVPSFESTQYCGPIRTLYSGLNYFHNISC